MIVVGDLKKPLSKKHIKLFLENLFPSFPYRFSSFNVNETLRIFGREGLKSKLIFWPDIRKGLREHKKLDGKNSEGLLIKSALNPNARVIKYWHATIDFIAVYYFVFVPVRICFTPWNSMLDSRALYTDLVADIATCINFVVLANTAYLNSRAAWVTNRYKLFRKVDLCASISATPFDW